MIEHGLDGSLAEASVVRDYEAQHEEQVYGTTVHIRAFYHRERSASQARSQSSFQSNIIGISSDS